MDVITTCGNTRVSTVVFDHCRVMQLLLDEYYNINRRVNKHGCYIYTNSLIVLRFINNAIIIMYSL